MTKKTQSLTVTRGAAERWRVEECYRQMEISYITDEQMRTVEYWWQQLAANVVGIHHAQNRARKGRWTDRRDKFRRGVVQGALQKAKYQAIRSLSKELSDMQALRDQTYEVVMAKTVGGKKILKAEPKSYEGCVRALVVVDQRVEALRDSLLSMVEPELRDSVQGGEVTPVFEQEDMREVVRMLLQRKRAKQVIGVDDVEDPDDED